MVELDARSIEHLRTGALFLACAIDHDSSNIWADRAITYMRDHGTRPALIEVQEMPPDALIATVGFVNSGLPVSEMRPVGDEFLQSLRLLEETVGQKVAGIIPLAAANINALVPIMTALQTGLPIIDADPMGRVFPLINQTVFAMAGVPIGPIATTGLTGESAVVHVHNPGRAERLVRVLAAEYGGWAATASYPMAAKQVADHAVIGSVSRMIEIGSILDSDQSTERKHRELIDSVGVRQIIRCRVIEIEAISRPAVADHPDRPSSVTLLDEQHDRIVRLEIQNELLMVMINGAVEAVVPDIITMLLPEDGSVAGLEDLWIGNRVDIVVLPGADQWYTERGIELVGPKALHVGMGKRGRAGR